MKEAYRDLEPFGYLLLAGAVVVLASVSASALVLSIRGIAQRWKWYANWSLIAITVAAGVITVLIVADPHRLLGPNEFPYLKQPPNLAELAATYRLPPFSISRIKQMNFAASDANVAELTVVLHPDGTFATTPAPDLWINPSGPKETGKCSGRWKVERWDSGVYRVLLIPESFSPRAAKAEQGLPLTVSAGIAAKTKTRAQYALAIPLFDGETDFIFIQ